MTDETVRLRAEAILRSLGRHVGIEDLAFDDSDYACLSFDDIVVNIEFDARRSEFVVYADLGELPANAGAAQLSSLLEANYLAALTGCGTLGISRETRRIGFVDRFLVGGMGESQFQERLAEIVDRIEAWKDMVSAPASAPAPTYDVSSSIEANTFIRP